MHNRLAACRRLISNSGIAASVWASVLRRLTHVQFARRAGAEAGFDNRQRLPLQFDVECA